jgi:hypothetical protein
VGCNVVKYANGDCTLLMKCGTLASWAYDVNAERGDANEKFVQDLWQRSSISQHFDCLSIDLPFYDVVSLLKRT